MSKQEDNLKVRGSQGKNTYMEEYLDGSPPQWKLYRNQMTLACLASKLYTELCPSHHPGCIVFYHTHNGTS